MANEGKRNKNSRMMDGRRRIAVAGARACVVGLPGAGFRITLLKYFVGRRGLSHGKNPLDGVLTT